MLKQAIVVGLGQFGMSLARSLTDRDVEVLAVDISEERVRAAANFVADAACFDATDNDALARTSPMERDICICSIGDEAKEASIICTALLRQMGAPRVIARANDQVHARILQLVGAHQVVNPEREFGQRFASQVLYSGVLGELPLGEDLLITELRPPTAMIGHTLRDLELPRRYGITVVAVRRAGSTVLLPKATDPLDEEDILVVVSKSGAVERMMERS